jgi:hypothetical protein
MPAFAAKAYRELCSKSMDFYSIYVVIIGSNTKKPDCSGLRNEKKKILRRITRQ